MIYQIFEEFPFILLAYLEQITLWHTVNFIVNMDYFLKPDE